MAANPSSPIDRRWRNASLLLFCGLVVYALLTFGQHGISNDEEVQHTYGRLLLRFYASGFTDRSAFDYLNLFLYGGLFDMVAAALQPLAPMSVWDLRHLLTAACGLSGILAAMLLAQRLESWRTAFLAVALLALTGAWSGAMFTHTKDIPFAAAMIWAVHGITCLVAGLPRARWRVVIGTGVAIGCALGLRVGGLFAFVYLGVAVGLELLRTQHSTCALKAALQQLVPRLLALLATSLAIMALAWPWSVMNWTNLFYAATRFSHFSFDMLTLLDGRLYKVGDVPATYLADYLLVRLPEVLLLGLLLATVCAAVAFLRGEVRLARVALAAPLLLAACFPLVFSLLTSPSLYNGIRHFTFLLPPLAVVAALGLNGGWQLIRSRRAAAGLCLVLAIAAGLDSAVTLWRLHPYEYVAYNHLVGGLRGAQGRWETDYWGDSLREASLRLNERVRGEADSAGATFAVAVCAEAIQASAYLDPRFRVTRDWPSADFFIAPTQTSCDRVLGGDVLTQIVRDGVALAVVKDRRRLVGHERKLHN